MATISEAVGDQLAGLMADLLRQDARTLTRMGISRRRRNYLNQARKDSASKLPPADVLLAALVLLRREVVIEGLSLAPRGGPSPAYSIGARERDVRTPPALIVLPVQISVLAALDFPPDTEATIERAERKGPHRVELVLNVGAYRKAV